MKSLDDPADLAIPVPVEELLAAIPFELRVRNRIREYLNQTGMTDISPPHFFDLCLPRTPFDHFSLYSDAPIVRQQQLGIYLHESAVISIWQAPLGTAWTAVWQNRLLYLKLSELRSFKSLRFDERRVEYSLPVPVQGRVVMHALSSGTAAADQNEAYAPEISWIAFYCDESLYRN